MWVKLLQRFYPNSLPLQKAHTLLSMPEVPGELLLLIFQFVFETIPNNFPVAKQGSKAGLAIDILFLFR